MDFRSRLASVFNGTLVEDVESRMPNLIDVLVGRKSRWIHRDKPDARERAQKIIMNASQWDPTSSKNYMTFVVRELGSGRIRLPEDGPHLKRALEVFSANSKRKEWKGPRDVMQFPSWRELQKVASDFEEASNSLTVPQTETEYVKKAKLGAEKIVDLNMETLNGPVNYVVVRPHTPEAVTVYGRGTRWCTSAPLYHLRPVAQLEQEIKSILSQKAGERNPWSGLDENAIRGIINNINGGTIEGKKEVKTPNSYYVNAIGTAQSYLRHGPMFVIFRNGKPVYQLTGNGGEIRADDDRALQKPGSGLAIVFQAIINSGKGGEAVPALQKHIDRCAKITPLLPKILAYFNQHQETPSQEDMTEWAKELQLSKQKPPTPPQQNPPQPI